MNHRIIFITALFLALLLHIGAGIIMVHDEKNRIQGYLETPEPIHIQLIPEEALLPPTNLQDLEDSEAQEAKEIERLPKEPSTETEEENSDNASPEEGLEEEAAQGESSEKIDEKKEEQQETAHKEASYQQNISKGGDILKESILPPREEGGYRRTVTTEDNPYHKLVEDAIELLSDTPFLDKEWKDEPEGEETPTYYSPEFMDLLKKYNPKEPINKKEEEIEEPPIPQEAEESDIDQFGNPKPVTLIVNQINTIDASELEEIAKRKEAQKDWIRTTNMINAAGSQIRRQEYNVALTSTKCYDTYIKGSNRKYSATVMILEDPKGTGIYRSTGNLALDNCIIEMTNLFIQIPAEMERIRKNAPRMGNGKGYLLNATF
ncbi:hypothetical protein MMG00_03575 [Ignatzschineria rhizosphaerae]|uniref:Energy transducer TonB n=1 Tax=Ignatzschineria rhizosphaerae TaxID=2923279 RepID=A0ABY3X231_9GAMM|nr:hypothetical protein [Ignatzschineria rhizosphaerae]UNM96943.1 hypothetical protein MMG00_03575 [Ignatzschineria rhizosphaerae]